MTESYYAAQHRRAGRDEIKRELATADEPRLRLAVALVDERLTHNLVASRRWELEGARSALLDLIEKEHQS